LENITIASWNIRSINQKMPEIISVLKKRKIDITVVTETKRKLKVRKRQMTTTSSYIVEDRKRREQRLV
jgi:exonuclease III